MNHTLTLLSLIVLLSGCVTIVDATHDGPIETDPSKRSFGQYIDDKKLKTVAAVNIKKAPHLPRRVFGSQPIKTWCCLPRF